MFLCFAKICWDSGTGTCDGLPSAGEGECISCVCITMLTLLVCVCFAGICGSFVCWGLAVGM
jgi:hypothetical protein